MEVIVLQRNMQLSPFQSIYAFSVGHQTTKTTVKRQDDLVWEVLGLLREERDSRRTQETYYQELAGIVWIYI